MGTRPGGATGAAITVTGVSKSYGPAGTRVLALHQVDLVVQRGEFVCLVGASGCGKSTLLNLIAGLDRPGGGEIVLGDPSPSLLFQDAALFPWLSVRGNVELPLKLAGVRSRERRIEAERLLDVVGLGSSANRRPHELSGGMRQRVALARALAQRSPIMLMDEPFGALDAITRDLLHEELEHVWATTGLTIVFVTHDVREAVRLGDRVVVMGSRPGRVAGEIPIDLPRPRDMTTPRAGALITQITTFLRSEVGRHAPVPAADDASPVSAPLPAGRDALSADPAMIQGESRL